MVKIVSMDQKDWIELLKQEKGKINDPEIQKSLEAVKRASEEGTAIFPITFGHLEESARRTPKDGKRDELLDFIIDISKGYAMVPYITIIDSEVRQAIRLQTGLGADINLREKIIGQGIPFVLGGKPELVKKTPDTSPIDKSLKKKIMKKIYSPETLRWSMKQPDIIEELRQNEEMQKNTIKEMERIREEELKIKDNKRRRNVKIAKHLIREIAPIMAKWSVLLGVKKEDVMQPGSSEKDIISFFQKIPSVYCANVLITERDMQKHRDIELNDINDISLLAISIPYCDIVVHEKMWVDTAQKKKLDDIYDTTLLTSVKDLYKYL